MNQGADPGTDSPASHATPQVTPAPAATVPDAAQTDAAPRIAGAALAGLADRAVATALDLVVTGAAFALIGMWAAVRWGRVTSDGFDLHGTAAGVAFVAVAMFAFLYVWLLEGLLGATLGKLILNVRVRHTDGSTIGLQPSLVRNLLRLIDGIGVYLVGFLIAIFSHLKQRLGDHLAHTVVVQSDPGPLRRTLAVAVWAAVIVVFFWGAYRLHRDAGAAGVAIAPVATAATSVPPAAAPLPAATAGEGRVIQAELGTDRTPDHQIVGPSSEFYTDTAQIVCVWTVEGVDRSVPINTVWIADDTGGAAPTNYRIGEKSISGSSEGSAFLSSPTNGWPVGTYHLEIYIGNRLAKQVPFTIKHR